jgi:hypothetical protein
MRCFTWKTMLLCIIPDKKMFKNQTFFKVKYVQLLHCFQFSWNIVRGLPLIVEAKKKKTRHFNHNSQLTMSMFPNYTCNNPALYPFLFSRLCEYINSISSVLFLISWSACV